MRIAIATFGLALLAALCIGQTAAPPASGRSATAPAAKPTATSTAPASLPFTLGYDTTRITKPLLPDGRPDYIAALNEMASKGVTKDNNTVLPIILALDEKQFMNDGMRQKVLPKLDLSLPAERTAFSSFAIPNGAAGKELLAMHDNALAGPWRSKDYPPLTKWLKENEKPLVLISQAANRSRWYFPLVTPENKLSMVNVQLPALSQLRSACRALVIRANMNIGEGCPNYAIPDLLGVHRMGVLLGQDPCLITQLVGIAQISVSDKAIAQHAAAGVFSASQAQELSKGLQDAGQTPKPSETIDRLERFSNLDYFLRAASAQPDELAEVMPELKRHMEVLKGVNCDTALRRINQWFDGMVGAMTAPSFADRLAAMADSEKRIQEFKEGPVSPSASPADRAVEAIMAVTIPTFGRAQVIADLAMVQRDLTVVALGLCAYKADTGKYPGTLDELAPKYLAKVPEDFCSGKPFIYKKISDGGYILYSVGENMKDDGGKARADGGDDLVVKTPSAATSTQKAN